MGWNDSLCTGGGVVLRSASDILGKWSKKLEAASWPAEVEARPSVGGRAVILNR